ncbi:hypothetical protein PSQ19_18145 [Devosia algicola]|uniref:Uncharacterized protein n=1 Tax=Devosia algicola TaxID=3026418 RepID=A0ABY7YMU9_9HYPH|nr:hypothetical protein [Devosia algicola]WDR02488.1 hypothetical protein PSQ19_18145 [Devosia algicola]
MNASTIEVASSLHRYAVLENGAQTAQLHCPQFSGNGAHGAQNFKGMLANILAADTTGPAGPDQRANRGARDDRWLDAQIIHRFDIGNVGQPTR